MNAAELSKALAIDQSEVFSVYTFLNPLQGLASPILASYSEFIEVGFTKGGLP
jgi:hypothetical protein